MVFGTLKHVGGPTAIIYHQKNIYIGWSGYVNTGPRCESTGPRMWKYWSPDMEILVPGCFKLCQKMLLEKLGVNDRQDKTVSC